MNNTEDINIYYLITNEDEKYNSQYLKDGINTITDTNKKFIFTDIDNIHEQLSNYDYNGVYIREITLPLNVKEQLHNNIISGIFESDIIFLSNKYKLNDIETIKKFELYKYNYNLINYLSYNGLLNIIEWLLHEKHEIIYTDYTIHIINKYNNINGNKIRDFLTKHTVQQTIRKIKQSPYHYMSFIEYYCK